MIESKLKAKNCNREQIGLGHCQYHQSANIWIWVSSEVKLPCAFTRQLVSVLVPLFMLLHRFDKNQPDWKSCIYGCNSCLQFRLYHVVVPLSFLRSNQPCSINMFLFLAHQIFNGSYLYQQHYFQSLAPFILRSRLINTCMLGLSAFSYVQIFNLYWQIRKCRLVYLAFLRFDPSPNMGSGYFRYTVVCCFMQEIFTDYAWD